MILRPLFLSLFCVAPIFAQPSFGLIGGVPFNDLTNNVTHALSAAVDKSGMYTIGPSFQFGLPLGFRLEADALYRPLGVGIGGTTLSSSQWRFPILAQYRFSGKLIKPFVEAGYSYDHVSLSPPPFLCLDFLTSRVRRGRRARFQDPVPPHQPRNPIHA